MTKGSRPFSKDVISQGFRADVAREKNWLGEKLRLVRKRRGMTLAQLADELRRFGVDVRVSTASHWETGESVPNGYQLLALCHALRISDGISFFTGFPPEIKTRLNLDGQRLLRDFHHFLESQPRYTETSHLRMVEMPVSTLAASAGFGDLLDDGAFEMQAFPANSIPEGADFAVRVNGDSMEPLYQHGQLVWVHSCERLSPGDTGLFVLNGEGYIKTYDERMPEKDMLDQYMDSDGFVYPQIVLISQNAAYEPKVVSPEADFRIRGKVLS